MLMHLQQKIEASLQSFLFKTVTDDLLRQMQEHVLGMAEREFHRGPPAVVVADAFRPVGYKLTKDHKMSLILENLSKTERRLEPVLRRVYSRRLAARVLKQARSLLTIDVTATFPPAPKEIEICGVISKN